MNNSTTQPEPEAEDTLTNALKQGMFTLGLPLIGGVILIVFFPHMSILGTLGRTAALFIVGFLIDVLRNHESPTWWDFNS